MGDLMDLVSGVAFVVRVGHRAAPQRPDEVKRMAVCHKLVSQRAPVAVARTAARPQVIESPNGKTRKGVFEAAEAGDTPAAVTPSAAVTSVTRGSGQGFLIQASSSASECSGKG